jgi:hypothetical protein
MVQMHTEEDETPYHVWKLTWDDRTAVLKKTSPEELAIYNTFLTETKAAPKVYAQGEVDGAWYMLMEYIPGETLCHCTWERLQHALDVLMELQRRYWQDTIHGDLGYGFAKCYPNREKRLPYMEDLTEAYEAYLQAFCTVPRTLCNDDMLPINVIVSEERAVILDWEYAGILPYPCALARLIAYGPEESGGLFHISNGDRAFALEYYYDHLIREMGISREEYDHTMKLFLLKEYSEWVYCAHSSGDLGIPYYKPNYARARSLAEECVR